MVDWDRVEELRSKGTDWSKIAEDPKVGFHADASAGDPGRALRALYHRGKARGRRNKPQTPTTPRPGSLAGGSRWTLIRIGFLAVPLVGVWFLVAYLVPSPVGLLVPAIPYLGIVLAVVAFVFVFALWRSTGRRWSTIYRSTLIGGVVLGLVIAGLIGLAGTLLFGCPYLPSASSLTSEPDSWSAGHMTPWQDSGKPVLYFYGATWCPFCSASSWAMYKALTEFGTVTGPASAFSDYSSSSDVDPSTPEVVLADLQFSSTTISFQVSEDTSGVEGTSPATTSCFQLAYVAAYGGGSIPFGVVNGQFVHAGATFVNPADLTDYEVSGDLTVKGSVLNETGTPWTVIQGPTWWIMTYLVHATGKSIGFLETLPGVSHWSAATISAIETDQNQTSF